MNMEKQTLPITNLKNHFLLAMPGLNDPNFSQSVVYICEHSEEGAMGLVINNQMDIPAKAIFDQLQLQYSDNNGESLIFAGGPVQRDRGFILHQSCGQKWESTVAISEDVSLTASKDILSDIAIGNGPEKSLITLGYSSWGAGQLEEELVQNSWLTMPANSTIIFNIDCEKRAHAAASSIGIDLNRLSLDSGHA
ncbi:MAG: YqgE/AlgH family protein [Porticoccaceae bacterium]|nr:YqgE/AlgH family protein [Porticoccaceae bacterium]